MTILIKWMCKESKFLKSFFMIILL
jgi:hypothetical protein